MAAPQSHGVPQTAPDPHRDSSPADPRQAGHRQNHRDEPSRNRPIPPGTSRPGSTALRPWLRSSAARRHRHVLVGTTSPGLQRRSGTRRRPGRRRAARDSRRRDDPLPRSSRPSLSSSWSAGTLPAYWPPTPARAAPPQKITGSPARFRIPSAKAHPATDHHRHNRTSNPTLNTAIPDRRGDLTPTARIRPGNTRPAAPTRCPSAERRSGARRKQHRSLPIASGRRCPIQPVAEHTKRAQFLRGLESSRKLGLRHPSHAIHPHPLVERPSKEGPGPGSRECERARPPAKTKPSRGRALSGGCCSGGVLLSHTVSRAVPSALEGLTTGFGMRPGVSPPP